MDEDEKLDLMDYVTDYLKDLKEIQEIMRTETVELQNLWARQEQLLEESFITSCSEDGISRYEKMLHITPLANDTLEARKFRVLTKWNTSVPYNFAYLEKQLAMLCSENGYRIEIDFAGQEVTVKVELTSKNMVDSVRSMLEDVLPCNLIRNVQLLYNTYGLLGSLTYAQMAGYTHEQLREEVIL